MAGDGRCAAAGIANINAAARPVTTPTLVFIFHSFALDSCKTIVHLHYSNGLAGIYCCAATRLRTPTRNLADA
jgi:hypothetical protein